MHAKHVAHQETHICSIQHAYSILMYTQIHPNTPTYTHTCLYIHQGEQAQNKRLVKDDVDWVVVAEKVGTRSNIQCLHKWYEVAPRVENNNGMDIQGDV